MGTYHKTGAFYLVEKYMSRNIMNIRLNFSIVRVFGLEEENCYD